MAEQNNKLVLAIMQEEDYDETVSALNQHGFFVTRLSSSGGFLKKRNVTVLIGVEAARYVELMDLLRGRAGKRKKTLYCTPTMLPGGGAESVHATIPVQIEAGGATVFTMALEGLEKI